MSLRPKARRKSPAGAWLIRCGFLALHLAMIGAALAWVGGWPPFSGQGQAAKAASPSTTKPAPPLAINVREAARWDRPALFPRRSIP